MKAKKTTFNKISALFIVIGLLSMNSLSAAPGSDTPDGKKKEKQETVQAAKEKADVKKAEVKNGNVDPIPEPVPEPTGEEATDLQNPYTSADCTKAGFDRE